VIIKGLILFSSILKIFELGQSGIKSQPNVVLKNVLQKWISHMKQLKNFVLKATSQRVKGRWELSTQLLITKHPSLSVQW